jgi:hypothetical protein
MRERPASRSRAGERLLLVHSGRLPTDARDARIEAASSSRIRSQADACIGASQYDAWQRQHPCRVVPVTAVPVLVDGLIGQATRDRRLHAAARVGAVAGSAAPLLRDLRPEDAINNRDSVAQQDILASVFRARGHSNDRRPDVGYHPLTRRRYLCYVRETPSPSTRSRS